MNNGRKSNGELAALNRLFIQALLALSEANQKEVACRLAAAGWSTLNVEHSREAERLNGVLHTLTNTSHSTSITLETPMSEAKLLDVRMLIPAERHRLIFEAYENLNPGESFLLVNDHDPKPLYYQFEAEHNGEFSWKYLLQGPQTWQMEIGRV